MFGDEAECCEGACVEVDAHPVRRDAEKERRQQIKAEADDVFMVLLRCALSQIRRCAGEGDPSEEKSVMTYEAAGGPEPVSCTALTAGLGGQ